MGGGERLLEHADHRHDARDRGLEAQLHAVLARAGPQLLAVLAEQLLVRGDDVPARGHRGEDVLAGGLEAAHHLDDEVRALEDVGELAAAAGEDADELRPQPGHRGDLVGALLEQRRERAADGAVAEQPDRGTAAASDIADGQVLVGLAAHDDAGVAVRRRTRPARAGWPLYVFAIEKP